MLDENSPDDFLVATFEKPENAITEDGQWVLWRVETVWVSQKSRRGRTDPAGGVTLKPPTGSELLIGIPAQSVAITPVPENAMTLNAFISHQLVPLARAVEQGLIDSALDNEED